MFGYSIKEVLEDNSMDIYMIMEALDTQKIHWYLKRKAYLCKGYAFYMSKLHTFYLQMNLCRRKEQLKILHIKLLYTEETFMSKQTMTIEELIKAGKMESSVEFPLKRYVVVNIGFFNNEDAEEETQLTLGHDPLTKEGIKELKELFTSLANEFDTKPNRVTYIHIVATAQTDKELKAMGY